MGNLNDLTSSIAPKVDTALAEAERPVPWPEGRILEERLKLAERHAQQARVFSKVLSSITDFAYTFDLDGRFTFVNKPLLDLWGLPLEQAVGRNFYDLHYPDDLAAKLQAQIQEVIRTRQRVVDETPYTSPSGKPGFYQYIFSPVIGADGEVEAVAGSTRDITDHKQREDRERRAAEEARATAEVNAKFRTFFEQGTQFAGVMTLDGTIVEANRLSLEGCGFARDQVIGKKFWECGWWNRSPELVEMVRGASLQAARGEPFQKEVPYFVADGSQRMVELTLAPVRDESGRVLFVAPTGVDITERKRSADERERLLDAERAARSEAERAGRLKDEFLATLSHELRTPLNAILGWAQILSEEGGKDADDLTEGLRTIERNARAQAQIIEDLLDMSRIISGKIRLAIQRIDLAGVVAGAVETIKPTADAKGIRLHAILDSSAALVSGDPSRLQQVFWNLLTNAVKFTPRGGRVQVLLERVKSHLEVSVIDSGQGIKTEFLPYVFDRFRQADAAITRKHGGLGLGLAIVKQLVELHGGSVRVQSAGEEQGAAFIVSLPMTVVQPEPESQTPRRYAHAGAAPIGAAEMCYTLKGVKVLVVDDEPDARALVKRLLEDCESEVKTASSAAEVMQQLESDKPDVLVSDIGMPGEDGFSLIRRIRALGPQRGGNIPAIALTAYARTEDRTRSLLAGFQMHIAKPVEASELIAMVASLAGRMKTGDV